MTTPRPALLASALLLALPLGAQEESPKPVEYESRQWTSGQGTSIEAKLVRFQDKKTVVLERSGGNPLTVPLASLSEADRDYAARIWAIENPTWICAQGQYWGAPSLMTVANTAGIKVVLPNNIRDPRRFFENTGVNLRNAQKTLATVIAKTKTAEAPVYRIDYWMWHLYTPDRRRALLRGLRALSGAELENMRVILIEERVPPEGVRHQEKDGERTVIPPEKVVAMRTKFTEEMKKYPNVEIAPAATIFDYVTEHIPEWKITEHNRTPALFRRLATITTITRRKPPVQAIQDAQRADPEGEYGDACGNLTEIPQDKIVKLEEFILQAVEKANPK